MAAKRSARLLDLQDEVADYMDAILGRFKPGAKITVLVRTPGNDEADFMQTNDDVEAIAAMVVRCARREDE